MLIQEKINKLDDLPASMRLISEVIMQAGEDLQKMTVKEIAAMAYTSTASVIRFTQRLGFSGFNDFKETFISEVRYLSTSFKNIDANVPFLQGDNVITIANKIGELEAESIKDTLALLRRDTLRDAVELLSRSERIFYTGVSSSLLIGYNFSRKMSRISKLVIMNDVVGEQKYQTLIMSKRDVALVVSYSGDTRNINPFVKLCQERKIPILGITSLGDSCLRRASSVVLDVSTREKLNEKIEGFASETSIGLILDILYSCCFAKQYERNYAQKVDFSKRVSTRDPTSDILKD